MTPWRQCSICNKIVKVNKPIIGSLHLCLSEEEISRRTVPYQRPPRRADLEALLNLNAPKLAVTDDAKLRTP